MDLSFAEYGVLGIVASLAISGMIYMFKKYHTVQESRLTEVNKHNEALLDSLTNQLNSNAAIKEAIKHTSITDKGALMAAIADTEKTILIKMGDLKTLMHNKN